ncbi:MAG TPA: respiratory nitrate reductase subunit gamma [Burkholderiaceae bacterium]|jgi:nitrate reductase gamma subunit|nr:respiratory nitrate reductase subunit gamma [Burkholderiaceae bacterium]
MDYLHQFFFGIYPYIALTVFLLGSLIRFDREQYTWKSESTQLLHSGSLRAGSILFHVGILGLFFGHAGGLLIPIWVWDWLGVTHSTKQMVAIVAGGIMGIVCLAGIVILLVRRFSNDRLLAVTTMKDKVVLIWILATLLLGLFSIFASAGHADGHVMVQLMTWAQHVVTFRGDAAQVIVDVPFIFKLHLFMGMSLFVIFPFTRLVHAWSGFGVVTYLGRAYQLVRPR